MTSTPLWDPAQHTPGSLSPARMVRDVSVCALVGVLCVAASRSSWLIAVVPMETPVDLAVAAGAVA